MTSCYQHTRRCCCDGDQDHTRRSHGNQHQVPVVRYIGLFLHHEQSAKFYRWAVRLCKQQGPLYRAELDTSGMMAENAGLWSPVHTSNNVEVTFDIVETIVQLVAFDNVASSLLLLWTGLKSTRRNFTGNYLTAARNYIDNSTKHTCNAAWRKRDKLE